MSAYRRLASNIKKHSQKPRRGLSASSAFFPMEALETRTLMAAVPVIAAPSNVTVSTVSEAALNVSWSGNPSDATQVIVERCAAGGRFRPVASLSADATSYSDSSLLPLTKYAYRVKASDGTAFSRPSRPGSATTASWLSATATSSTEVRLDWTDYSIGERQFIIDRAGARGRFTRLATLSADSTSFTDTGLLSDTVYNYRIRPVGGAPRLRLGTATTSTSSPDPDPGPGPGPDPDPGPGPGPDPDPGTSSIPNPGSNAASGYSAVDGTWGVVNGSYQASAPGTVTTSHLNTRSVYGTALDGDFTLSVDASVVNTDSAFNDFAVIFGYQDGNDYYFFSSNESNDTSTNGIFKVVNGVTTELADASSTITAGTTYHVRVERAGDQIRALRDGVLVASATDATFTSGEIGFGTKNDQATFSNLVVTGALVTPPTSAPAAPTGMKAVAASSTSVSLTWVDNSSDEGGFNVERSGNGGSTWAAAGKVAAGVTSYTATGLSASTTYSFRVRAFNAAGDSANSNAASATTPAAPTPTPTGDRPGLTNTGPTDASALQARGSITVTIPGTVIENVNVTGTITIEAANVTIRNFRINASGNSYGITATTGATGIVIEDGEIFNANGDGVYGEGYTARRLNIHNTGGDGLKHQGNGAVEYCWVHDLGTAPGAHADGVQVMSGSNIVIRGNYFDMPIDEPGTSSNSAVFIRTAFGPISNIVVEGNWMNGGNYTVYSVGYNGVIPTNVRILNNRFGRDYRYGPLDIEGSVVVTGNVWDDTGAPLNA